MDSESGLGHHHYRPHGEREQDYREEELRPYLERQRIIFGNLVNTSPQFAKFREENPEEFEALLRVQAAENMRISHIDPRTGLLNKLGFDLQLKETIADARRTKNKFAVIFLDGNGFKAINDTYGHKFGDRIIEDTATSLSEAVRANDIVARVGGDEYILILKGVYNIDDILKVVSRVQTKVEVDVRHKNPILTELSVSAGVAFSADYDLKTVTPEMMVKDADSSLYATKGRDAEGNILDQTAAYGGLVRGNNIGIKIADQNGKPMFIAIPRDLRQNDPVIKT